MAGGEEAANIEKPRVKGNPGLNGNVHAKGSGTSPRGQK